MLAEWLNSYLRVVKIDMREQGSAHHMLEEAPRNMFIQDSMKLKTNQIGLWTTAERTF